MSALTTPHPISQEPPQNCDARHSQRGVVSLELHDPSQTLLEPDDHHLPDNRVRSRSQPAALLGSAPRGRGVMIVRPGVGAREIFVGLV